jgi:hypothetical protein
MKRVFTAKMLLLFAVFALCCIRADAQAVPALENMNSQAELDKAITTLDASLFDAYSRCDLEKFRTQPRRTVRKNRPLTLITYEINEGATQL